METLLRRKVFGAFFPLFALLIGLFLLAPTSVQAAQFTIKIDTGSSLESALTSVLAQQGDTPLEEIDRLVVTGNGTLTEADGMYIRERLTNLHTLNLRGFTGSSGDAAFRGCISLRTVMLPERFVLSREMFYGCTALEDVVWPVRYQLTKDCFAYCALDFSGGYPNLLNDTNILTYAANQRPKVYFTLPRGKSSSISVGQDFRTPYALETRSGESYPNLIAQKPKWLLTRESELEIAQTVMQDGTRLNELNTNETGKYAITYSLPYATYADTRTQTFTLNIVPSHRNLSPLIQEVDAMENAGYTEESWAELERTLQEAKQLMEKDGVQQTALDTARTNLDKALAGLQLSLDGAPSTALTVGDSFTLTPGKNGGMGRSNWQWDTALLDATFTGGATFTALQAGETEVVYLGRDGKEARVLLTIVEVGESAPAPVQPSPKTTSPEGGLWVFAGLLFLGILLAMAAAWWLEKKKKKT